MFFTSGPSPLSGDKRLHARIAQSGVAHPIGALRPALAEPGVGPKQHNARIKIQFNGVGGFRTYINFTHIEQRIAQNMNVHAQAKNRRGDLIPVIVAVIVAVVGTAGILNNLRAGNDSQDSGNARMITSAAVSRAGAIEIPSEPPAGRRQRGDST